MISGAAPDSKSVAAVMSVMRMTGGIPMLVSNHSERVGHKDDLKLIMEAAHQDLAKADGIIVMGNDLDIDPRDYGEEKIHKATRSEKATPKGLVRAVYESKLIEGALKMKLPLLGICGGMQRLNVLLGGTLHQHVPDLIGSSYHHQGEIAPFIPVQYVSVVPGTMLASISKEVPGLFTPSHDEPMAGIFMDNSFHHQAVDRVGNGLIPCAFSIEPDHPDLHIVQAIEAAPRGPYSEQFVLGLQWHPEFGASDVSVRSLQNFNEIVQIYARAHPKGIAPEEALAVTAYNLIKEKFGFSAAAGGSIKPSDYKGLSGSNIPKPSTPSPKSPGGKKR